MAFLRSELRTEPDCNFQQLAVCNNFCSFWSLCFALLRSSPFRCPLLSGRTFSALAETSGCRSGGSVLSFYMVLLGGVAGVAGRSFRPSFRCNDRAARAP